MEAEKLQLLELCERDVCPITSSMLSFVPFDLNLLKKRTFDVRF